MGSIAFEEPPRMQRFRVIRRQSLRRLWRVGNYEQ